MRIGLVVAITMAIFSRGAFGQVSPDPSTDAVRISGRVMDSRGAPIPHAAVKLRVMGVGDNPATTETDENGRFTFPAAVPQHHELFFEAQGFSRLTVPVQTPNNSRDINLGIVVLEVAPIETPSEVPYYLAPVQESLNGQTSAAKIPGSTDTRRSPFGFATGSMVSNPPGGGGAVSELVCEVLSNPREYIGQEFTFEGFFVHGVHATYFLPDPKCGDQAAIQAVGFTPLAYGRRRSVLVTARGKILIHRQTPEPRIGKPDQVIAFSVTHVSNIGAAQPPNQ
jgi:hypothetical protein